MNGTELQAELVCSKCSKRDECTKPCAAHKKQKENALRRNIVANILVTINDTTKDKIMKTEETPT